MRLMKIKENQWRKFFWGGDERFLLEIGSPNRRHEERARETDTTTNLYSGEELLVSLTDKVTALTTKFLKGLNLVGFIAQTTRGASVTTLILLGLDPHVIAALGDWKSYDCFRRFYDKVRTSLPCTQALVPESYFRLPQLP